MENTESQPKSNQIIPPELAIKAMQDGGYKNHSICTC